MSSLDEKIEAAKRKVGQANRELQALRKQKQEICKHTWKIEVRTPFSFEYCPTDTWKVCSSCDKEVMLKD